MAQLAAMSNAAEYSANIMLYPGVAEDHPLQRQGTGRPTDAMNDVCRCRINAQIGLGTVVSQFEIGSRG